jgi:hypothetical protein
MFDEILFLNQAMSRTFPDYKRHLGARGSADCQDIRCYRGDSKAAPPEFKSQGNRWYHWFDRVDIADAKT